VSQGLPVFLVLEEWAYQVPLEQLVIQAVLVQLEKQEVEAQWEILVLRAPEGTQEQLDPVD